MSLSLGRVTIYRDERSKYLRELLKVMASHVRDLAERKRQQLERELDRQHAEEEVNEEGLRKLD